MGYYAKPCRRSGINEFKHSNSSSKCQDVKSKTDFLKMKPIRIVRLSHVLFTRRRCYMGIIIFVLLHGPTYAQKTVRYDLYVSDTTVNYTGKKAKAIAVN